MMANPLVQTGNVLRLLGRHEEARNAIGEALRLMTGREGSELYAIALSYMGHLSLELGDAITALDYFRQAETLAKEQRGAVMTLSCQRAQADALCRLGRPDAALTILSTAFAAARALGNGDEQVRMLRIYAELYFHFPLPPPKGMSAPSPPLHYLNLALTVAASIEGYTLSAELLDEVAHAYAACGDHHRAYVNARAAAAARNNTRLDAARNRAIAMQMREATERARAEAAHHRQLAQMEANRVAALQESIATLETLGLIGRKITMDLDLDITLESIYGAINEVMDAPSLMIAVVDDAQVGLDCRLVMTQGKRQEPFRVLLTEENFGCWCVKHRSHILIGDIETEHSKYLSSAPEMIYRNTEKSLVFVPLILEDRVLGLISVQSPQRQAYDKRTVGTVRAIGAYIAIAIENSRLFKRVLDSESSLRLEHTALLNAQTELKRLHGVLPICSAYKKIRDDGGGWHQLESYIRDHSEAEFTHGICPECVNKLYGHFLKPKGPPPKV
jgi:GAF domain-containing protein